MTAQEMYAMHAARDRRRKTLIAVAVVLVIVLGAFVWQRVQQQRASDRTSDVFYCTLSGVSVFDRGPNTGMLCADLLRNP